MEGNPMSGLKEGDLVVCIKECPVTPPGWTPHQVVVGKTYTIVEFVTGIHSGKPCVVLQEMPWDHCYWVECFRKLEPPDGLVDEIYEALKAPVPQKEELVCKEK